MQIRGLNATSFPVPVKFGYRVGNPAENVRQFEKYIFSHYKSSEKESCGYGPRSRIKETQYSVRIRSLVNSYFKLSHVLCSILNLSQKYIQNWNAYCNCQITGTDTSIHICMFGIGSAWQLVSVSGPLARGPMVTG